MANVPVLQQLVALIAPIARQLGVPMLVIAAKDPTTGEVAVFGSEEAKTAVRNVVEEKFAFGGDTAWNDSIV